MIIYKEPLNKSPTADDESFPPILRFEKWEIHKVFRHFSNLVLTKSLSPSTADDSIRASLDVQNAESDAERGDHNKSEEGVVTLVIARLSTARFLETIEETLYHIPPFIRLFIKQPRLLCVHFRRDRIIGGLVMQIGPDLFCAIGFVGKNIAVLQTRKQLQQRNCLRAIINISGGQQKSHRPQVFSDDGMDFRVQTSACFADAA